MSQIRISNATSLRLHYEPQYEWLPLMPGHGPYIREYLDGLYSVLDKATDQYRRVLAVRIDLRFPHDMAKAEIIGNECIGRFLASLRAKVDHDRSRSAALYGQRHGTRVRYIWGREFGVDGKPHYHLLLVFNRDAYFSLGKFISDKENMYQRICAAWAGALGCTYDEGIGLVHVPEKAEYRINSPMGFIEVFRRASYICKAATKQYEDGYRNFGYSYT